MKRTVAYTENSYVIYIERFTRLSLTYKAIALPRPYNIITMVFIKRIVHAQKPTLSPLLI